MHNCFVVRLVVCVAFALFGAGAGAIPFYSGTIQGVFSSPVLAGSYLDVGRNPVFLDNSATAAYSLVNNSTAAEVISGDDLGGAGAPSTIIFFGAAFNNVRPGEEFDLGTVTYFNGSSNLTSLLYGATLTLSVVGQPSITPIVSHLGIVTTANGGTSPVLDADFLTFAPLALTFDVYEGAAATGMLRGAIIGDPQLVLTNFVLAPGQGPNGFVSAVPEPASLLLLALGGVAIYTRRRGRSSETTRCSDCGPCH